MNGFVLINKPCGVTSFSVTGKVRRALSVDKAGHAGTLDPIATGVLPVMVGRATKLIDILPDEKKTYLAGFMLGMTTDTLDCEGEVLTEQPVNVTKEQIESAIAHFTGKIDQVPPMYSALSKDGVKLYQLARKGIEVERKARSITIFSNELVSYDENTNIGIMRVCCSKGTYIRTLIDDIGMYLRCGAFMTTLTRERGSGFDIESCVPLEDFLECPKKYFIDVENCLTQFPKVYVSDSQAKRFSNGGALDTARCKLVGKSGIFRVYGNNALIGLGEIVNDELKLKWLK